MFLALWHPEDVFSSLKVSCLHSRHVGLLLGAGKQAASTFSFFSLSLFFLIVVGWKVHTKWAAEVWGMVMEKREEIMVVRSGLV